MMTRLFIVIVCFFTFLINTKCFSQQTAEKYIRETRYLLALPAGYEKDTAKRWPLVLFLHGSGQRGADVEKVKDHGPPKLAAQGKQFPFILVSPQAEQGWDTEELMRLLLHIKKSYRVDADRVYLTGLSMGGYGTWNMAAAYPQEFAAIVPICGGGDTSKAWKLRNMPIWCFHGAKDNIVSPKESISMVDAIKKYNPSIRFTLYPDADHNSWDAAYGNDSLYQWMLSQKRFLYSERTVDSSILRRYVGTYLNERLGDTVTVFLEKGKLQIRRPNGRISPLKAAAENLFYFYEFIPGDVSFVLSNGIATGFLVMANDRYYYRKQ